MLEFAVIIALIFLTYVATKWYYFGDKFVIMTRKEWEEMVSEGRDKCGKCLSEIGFREGPGK